MALKTLTKPAAKVVATKPAAKAAVTTQAANGFALEFDVEIPASTRLRTSKYPWESALEALEGGKETVSFLVDGGPSQRSSIYTSARTRNIEAKVVRINDTQMRVFVIGKKEEAAA